MTTQLTMYLTRDRYGYCIHYEKPGYSKKLDVYYRRNATDIQRPLARRLIGALPANTRGKNLFMVLNVDMPDNISIETNGRMNMKLNKEEMAMEPLKVRWC